MPSRLVEAATREADHARADLAIGQDTAIVDILDSVERTAGIPVTILALPGMIAGACLREREQNFIFLNGSDDPSRQRFTLAHEYGHARLGHLNMVDTHDQMGASTKIPVEVQANAFAAAFLAPERALRAWLAANAQKQIDIAALVRLATNFGMSPLAMRYRLQNTGVLTSKNTIAALDAQIEQNEHIRTRYRLGIEDRQDSVALAKTKSLPRLPGAMQDLGLAGYERGVLTLQRLAEGLQRPIKEIAAELDERGIAPLVEEPATAVEDIQLAAELDALLKEPSTE